MYFLSRNIMGGQTCSCYWFGLRYIFFNQRIFPSNITNVLLFIFLKTSDQLFDIGKQNSRSDSSLLYSVVYQTEVKIQDDVKAEAVQLSFNIGWENHQKCSKRVTFYYWNVPTAGDISLPKYWGPTLPSQVRSPCLKVTYPTKLASTSYTSSF